MKWINIKDELPEENTPVLGTQHEFMDPAKDRYHMIMVRIGDQWIDAEDDGVVNDPTHWMPLPEFPEES